MRMFLDLLWFTFLSICLNHSASSRQLSQVTTMSTRDAFQHLRVFSIDVPLSRDTGKDHYLPHPNLLKAIEGKLKIKEKSSGNSNFKLSVDDVTVVRKSFDGRLRNNPEPRFVYTVDIVLPQKFAKSLRLKYEDGKIEVMTKPPIAQVYSAIHTSTIPSYISCE